MMGEVDPKGDNTR